MLLDVHLFCAECGRSTAHNHVHRYMRGVVKVHAPGTEAYECRSCRTRTYCRGVDGNTPDQLFFMWDLKGVSYWEGLFREMLPPWFLAGR